MLLTLKSYNYFDPLSFRKFSVFSIYFIKIVKILCKFFRFLYYVDSLYIYIYIKKPIYYFHFNNQ